MNNSGVYEMLQSAARGLIGIDRRLMHALVDDPAKSVPDMLKFASEDRSDDPLDLEPDLIAAFRYLRTPEALPYLMDRLRENGTEADEDLVQAVIEQGREALETILKLYSEMEEDESDEVAFTLAGLGVRDDRILRLLLERLEYDAADGAMSLAVYGDPAAIPEIRRMLDSIPAENASLRQDLTEAIEDLERGPLTAEAHEFHLFERYPEEAGPDYDILSEEHRRELLSSDDAKVRARTARTFFLADFDNDTLARLLELARADADATVRGRAWEALSGEEDPEIVNGLRAVAFDPERPVEERAGALVGLAAGSDSTPELRQAIEALYDEPGGRAKAMEAMWRSFDRTFAKYFPPHLEDPDPAIRVQAIFGTGYLGIGTEAERVASYFRDDDLRPDALFSYALCVPAEISRGRIRGVFRKIERAAGGLNSGEAELVETALDQRLLMHGLEPVFAPAEDEEEHGHEHGPWCQHDGEEDEVAPSPAVSTKVGRNDPCPCGSGKKYKKCHGA